MYRFVNKVIGKRQKEEPLTKKELPYTIGMVVLDIIAPILLMFGISRTNAANVSLLNNFEIVATSLIALVIFKEVISRKLWAAIGLVTVASAILSFEGSSAFVWRFIFCFIQFLLPSFTLYFQSIRTSNSMIVYPPGN